MRGLLLWRTGLPVTASNFSRLMVIFYCLRRPTFLEKGGSKNFCFARPVHFAILEPFVPITKSFCEVQGRFFPWQGEPICVNTGGICFLVFCHIERIINRLPTPRAPGRRRHSPIILLSCLKYPAIFACPTGLGQFLCPRIKQQM